MDLAQLTIRDWMVIAGVLLILAVLLDAFRRVRNERNSPVRVKLASEEGTEQAREVDLAWLKELPNGGARIITRDGMSPEEIAESAEHSNNTTTQTEEVELVTGMNAVDDVHNIDWLDELDEDGEKVKQGSSKTPVEAAPRLTRQPDPEVFMLNVVARSPAGFNGGDLLHILLACDLRFGDMSFFHRYEQEGGLGPIQFSVANMMQPGVFDIDNMSDVTTPGLVFFLTLPGPEDMMQAFDYMFETAQAVARNLEGDVLDESRSAMTKQVVEHSRQKIVDLERRMLAQTER
jgi:cell division protein ZipA